MAFARRTTRRSYSGVRRSTASRRSPVRRAASRRVGGGRSAGAGRQHTVKIVVEQAPASAVSRPSLFVGQPAVPSKKARL